MILSEFAITFKTIPTIVKIVALITSVIQVSYDLIACIQIKKTVEEAVNSMAIQKGLSIMNIGVIKSKAIKVVAGTRALLELIKPPNIKSKEIER